MLLEIEDLTGRISALVNHDKVELFEKCKEICENNFIITNNYTDGLICKCYNSRYYFEKDYLKQEEEFYKLYPLQNVTKELTTIQ